jgi:hypothetical protein
MIGSTRYIFLLPLMALPLQPFQAAEREIGDFPARSQRNTGFTLLPAQQPLRGLLGIPLTRRLTVHIYVAHPWEAEPRPERLRPTTTFAATFGRPAG